MSLYRFLIAATLLITNLSSALPHNCETSDDCCENGSSSISTPAPTPDLIKMLTLFSNTKECTLDAFLSLSYLGIDGDVNGNVHFYSSTRRVSNCSAALSHREELQ
jgi:hypothetical protein